MIQVAEDKSPAKNIKKTKSTLLDQQKQNIIRFWFNLHMPHLSVAGLKGKGDQTFQIQDKYYPYRDTVCLDLKKKQKKHTYPRWGFTIADFALFLQVLLFICIFIPS